MSSITIRDLPLLSRAARQRWEIPPHARKSAIEALNNAINSPETKPDIKIRAVATLGRLDALNLKSEEINMARADATLDITNMSDEDLKATLEMLKSQTINMVEPEIVEPMPKLADVTNDDH